MREQRAFAAVWITPSGTLCVMSDTIRFDPDDAMKAAKANWDGEWNGNWDDAQLKGWRIRPVLIRIEDNGGKDD